MGARGPLPLSRRVLAARGSRRAVTRRDLVAHVDAAPEPPAGLPDGARERFLVLAGLLVESGRWSAACGPAAAAAASAWHIVDQAHAAIARDGLMLDTPRGPRTHPAVAIAARFTGIMTRLLTDLGLTPQAAARLESVAPLPDPPRDHDRERFFADYAP